MPPEWGEAIRHDQLRTSPVVMLELLHSTRSQSEFDEWDERLSRLRSVPVTATACQAAIGALRELAHQGDGFHRVGLGDALLAASASEAPGVGVLHYNPRDFDKLASVLTFQNVVLAAPGTFERGAGAPMRGPN